MKNVARGVVGVPSEIITVIPRFWANFSEANSRFARRLEGIGQNVESRVVDDPAVIPDAVGRGVSAVVDFASDLIGGTVKAAGDTVQGVGNSVNRALR